MSKKNQNQEKEEPKEVVAPVHFCIDEKDVQATSDAGAFTITKAGGYMHYATKGGYHIFVDMSYRALYDTLDLLLETLTNAKESGETNETLSEVADFVSSLLFAPTVIFSDEESMFKAFECLQEIVTKMAEKSTQELQPQDFEANHDYEESMKFVEKAEQMLKDIDAEQSGN